MKNLLEKEIPELEQKVDEIIDESESAQLKLVILQCRQLLKDGHFLDADEILHQVSQRVEYLHDRKTVKP